MYEPIYWWWMVFSVMFVSGVAGGFARYHWNKTENADPSANSCFSYIVMGVTASFLVPLFLNTISSTLIEDTEKQPAKFFILIGMCIASSVYAKKFIGPVVKALKDAQKAKEVVAFHAAQPAQPAPILPSVPSLPSAPSIQSAAPAETPAANADSRAIALYRPLKLIDSEKYQEAIQELEDVIVFDPKNAEAWAWKAFCLKRQLRFKDAAAAVEKALQLEGKDIFKWLYNLACYKCLSQSDVAEVIAVLERIRASATPNQVNLLAGYLKSDNDFARIKENPKFAEYLKTF